MAIHDFRSQRLYVTTPLSAGAEVQLADKQKHYLINVLRLSIGDGVLLFDGQNGEWSAVLKKIEKKTLTLDVQDQIRPQQVGPDLDYIFAPLKRARLDYMVQKAVELGVRRVQPVITKHTIVDRVNLERMQANAVEAAEQCGVLHLPEIFAPEKFEKFLSDWDPSRRLIFCDEVAAIADPIAALRALSEDGGSLPISVIIGPEGGFHNQEREALLAQPFTTAISLGPRVMRADTAGVSALSLINATLGDWR